MKIRILPFNRTTSPLKEYPEVLEYVNEFHNLLAKKYPHSDITVAYENEGSAGKRLMNAREAYDNNELTHVIIIGHTELKCNKIYLARPEDRQITLDYLFQLLDNEM